MGLYLKVAPGVRVGRSTAPPHGAAARIGGTWSRPSELQGLDLKELF